MMTAGGQLDEYNDYFNIVYFSIVPRVIHENASHRRRCGDVFRPAVPQIPPGHYTRPESRL
jgi:hypothetical protein